MSITRRARRAEAAATPTAAALARAEAPVSVSRLVSRFVLAGLVALVVVAVTTAYASRVLGTNEAIADADRRARLIVDAALEPAITPGVVAQDPDALAALDEIVQERVLIGDLVRVKIWSAEGVVLYSDEPRLIGRQFDLDEDELELIESGTGSAAGISDLSEEENQFENAAVELLEVYVPVQATDGTPLLFEGYFYYAGVSAAGRDVWLRFAPYSLGALVLLELLQIPLAISMARRLRRSQQEREELLHGALEAADEERRRIASDLHDGVVQDLAGVAFSLGALTRQDGRLPEESAEIRQAADRVRDGVRSLRSLLVEIYPPNLYDEGLEAVLSDLLARLQPRGIEATLLVEAPLQRLDLDRTQLMYRVAQEGLRNVLKHADATRVTVSITGVGDTVLLEVTDDGRGLEGDEVPDRPGHLGLRALASMAASLGSRLSLRSAPGEGTTLALEVPVT